MLYLILLISGTLIVNRPARNVSGTDRNLPGHTGTDRNRPEPTGTDQILPEPFDEKERSELVPESSSPEYNNGSKMVPPKH